mmetsp:Transcript_99279/g.256713  ORF Transcript_99279/g.256713 Transcript_99279/m.256713 type:complete len:210 (+) Transcript_99279:1132-1761(+)
MRREEKVQQVQHDHDRASTHGAELGISVLRLQLYEAVQAAAQVRPEGDGYGANQRREAEAADQVTEEREPPSAAACAVENRGVWILYRRCQGGIRPRRHRPIILRARRHRPPHARLPRTRAGREVLAAGALRAPQRRQHWQRRGVLDDHIQVVVCSLPLNWAHLQRLVGLHAATHKLCRRGVVQPICAVRRPRGLRAANFADDPEPCRC